MSLDMPDLRFEVNFEDDPYQAHPAYLESLATGPIGWWRLNELTGTNANDQGSAGIDGTYTGGYTLGVEGAFTDSYGDVDTAVDLNGSTGYVGTATSSTWQNLHAAWSIGAWIYPTASRAAANTAGGIILIDRNSVGRIPFVLVYGNWQGVAAEANGNYLSAGYWTGAGWERVVHQVAVTVNEWTHVLATWDGATLALYKNGSPAATSTPAAANGAASAVQELYIGRGTNDSNFTFFPGRIDEAVVFDYALTEPEAAQLARYLTIKEPDEGNYVDLSDRLRSSSVRRGRSDPASRVDAGNMTVVVDNQDGLLLPPPIVNLLANPSNESIVDEDAYLPLVAETATLIQDTTHVRTGSYAWKLTSGTSIPGYATSARDGLVGMRPGKTYTFSAYLYVPTGVTLANVRVEIVDEIAGSQEIQSTSTPAALDAFHRLEVTKTIRDTADAAYVRVRLNEASGSIWFDDIQLEEDDAATTYCDGDQADGSWAGERYRGLSRRRRSPSAPRKVVPMRRCRLVAEWDSVDYDVFHGYVDRFVYTFPGMDTDSVVTMNVADGTRILGNVSMRDFTRSVERPGDRVRAILDWAGIAPDDYDVDDTYITAQSLDSVTVSDDRTALSMIRDIEATERGVFFVSRAGLFTYQGSEFRSAEGAEQFLLQEGTAAVPYSDIAAVIDLAGVVNDTKIENVAHSSDYTFTEGHSQEQYLTLSTSESSLWDQDEVSYVYRGEPHPLADGVTVLPRGNPDVLWPAMLGLELGDLGRIERVRNGATDLFAGYMQFLEGIEHNVSPADWTMALRTSPTPVAPTSASLWQTPITKPSILTSKASAVGGSSPITMPSATFVAGRLYIILFGGWGSGGATPTLPTITATNTFTNQDNLTSAGLRHATWSSIATSTVTEALSFSFGTPPGAAYDIVILEILEGFQAGTPVGDHPGTQTGGQTSGQNDVGTLTDARSIVIFSVMKAAAANVSTSGAVQVYNRAGPGSTSYHAGYAFPNVDTVGFDWGGVGNGWASLLLEIEAT